MAFPQVADVTESEDTGGGASVSVAMPATVNAGDLLVMIVAANTGNTSTLGTPSGWTKILQTNSGDQRSITTYYKVASGSEGGTSVTISLAGDPSNTAHQVYRITSHNSSAPPVLGTTGASTTPTSPSVTPSWGAKDTLWISAAAGSNTTDDGTAPTNYGNFVGTLNTGGAPYLGSARRELNAASEDPGNFGAYSNSAWAAHTIAIEPSAASAATKMKYYNQRRAA